MLAATVGYCAEPNKDKGDLDSLIGSWIVESSEKGPAPISPVRDMPIIRAADKLVFYKEDGNLMCGVIRSEHPDKLTRTRAVAIDPLQSPKHIDVGEGKNVYRGIYKLGRDRLTICIGDREERGEEDRPAAFKANSDTELTECRRERKR